MIRAVGILMSVACMVSAGAAAAAQPPAGDAEARDYIVMLRETADRAPAAAAIRGEGGTVRRSYRAALNGYAVTMSTGAARRLRADPRVAAVVADTVVSVGDGPIATGAVPVSQGGAVWGLDRIDQRTRPLDGVYRYVTDGAGVRAYIVDTGIRTTHSEFTGRTAPGMTAVADGGGTADCHGHGTHVAGTVAGTVDGVAKAATVVPVRVLGCTGSGSSSGVVAGLDWIAANHPAGTPGVANLSLGGGANPVLDQAVRNLSAAGVTVVVAAGNDAGDACLNSPGRVAEAITVGSSTSSDTRSSFSNHGACVDLFAPGSSIRAAHHTGDTATAYMSGTSMAAPHVAGVAARLLSRSPAATPAQVQAAVVADATTGVLSGVGAGSPNLLLNADPLAGVLITTIGVRPASLINTSHTTVQFTANAPATFHCRLDDGPWAACASPHTLTGLTDGTHILRVRATDGDGNVEAAPAQATFTVDTTAPTTSIATGPVLDGAVTVTFSADEQATHACRLDGAPFTACTSPWRAAGLAEGDHVVEVRATDAAGNVEDPPARAVVRVEAPATDPAPAPEPSPGAPVPPGRRPATGPDRPGPFLPAPAMPPLRVGEVRVAPLAAPHGRTRQALAGLAVAVSLTGEARIDVVAERRMAGLRRAGRCVAPTAVLRRSGARSCVRFVRVGAVSGPGEAGVNRLALLLPQRGPRALRPGRYRVAVVARAPGGPSAGRRTDVVIRPNRLR